jgi:hypothetical protein
MFWFIRTVIRHLFYEGLKSRSTLATCKVFVSEILVALVLQAGCGDNVSGTDENSLKATK